MVTSNVVVSAIAAALIFSLSTPSYQVKLGDYFAVDSVGVYIQMPDYPAGCEPASLSLLLKSYSYEANIDELMGYFDLTTDDFVHGYWGSIYSEGAAYPPAVVEAANRYLSEQGSRLEAREITGYNWDAIERLIFDGKPIMMWCTTDYAYPYYLDIWEIDGYYMYANEHCVVLYGVDEENVYVSDPLQGLISYPKEEFERIWVLCGSMAVILDISEE